MLPERQCCRCWRWEPLSEFIGSRGQLTKTCARCRRGGHSSYDTGAEGEGPGADWLGRILGSPMIAFGCVAALSVMMLFLMSWWRSGPGEQPSPSKGTGFTLTKTETQICVAHSGVVAAAGHNPAASLYTHLGLPYDPLNDVKAPSRRKVKQAYEAALDRAMRERGGVGTGWFEPGRDARDNNGADDELVLLGQIYQVLQTKVVKNTYDEGLKRGRWRRVCRQGGEGEWEE